MGCGGHSQRSNNGDGNSKGNSGAPSPKNTYYEKLEKIVELW